MRPAVLPRKMDRPLASRLDPINRTSPSSQSSRSTASSMLRPWATTISVFASPGFRLGLPRTSLRSPGTPARRQQCVGKALGRILPGRVGCSIGRSAAVERQKRHHAQRHVPVRGHAQGEFEQLLGAGPGSEPAADPGQGLLAVVAVRCQGHRNGRGVEQGAGHRPDREPFEDPGAGGADDEHVRAQFLGRLDQRVRVGITAADVGLRPGHRMEPAPGPGRATPGPAR